MWLCIKAKLRGKNFLLNWLYIHEKKNHNVSLSLSLSLSLSPLSVFVCLMVPTVYTLPVSTFTHCYQSHFLCGIKSSFPSTRFHFFFSVSQPFIYYFFWHTGNQPWSADSRQVMHFSCVCVCVGWGGISTFKGLIHLKPDLACFLSISDSLFRICGYRQRHFLGDKGIFSSLEPLAQQWIIILFQGKAQTAFFCFSCTSCPFISNCVTFINNVRANAEE